MTNKEKMEKIMDAIEHKEMCVNEYEIGAYEIEFLSDAGEDFIFSLSTDGTAEGFARAIAEYAADFDEEEHAVMWHNAGQNGVSGVPSLKVLMNDAESIQQYLDELSETVFEAIA